jgi:hypothetical protein
MTLVRDADLDQILADWGKPVTTGSYSAVPGYLLGARDALETGVDVRAQFATHVLRIKPGTLGVPVDNQDVTVDGVAFVYRGVPEGDDEAWERWLLAKVAA